MSNKVFARLNVRRHPKASVTAVVVAALGLLTAIQGVGSASATSHTSSGNGWECSQGTACLWNNSHRGKNTSEKLIITPGSADIPDMEEPTPLGKGVVHSTTAAFHDSISLGQNLMAWDLCMIDTEPLANGEYQNFGAIVVIPADGGQFWAGYKKEYNDTFDTYTTARPGECPSNVRFKGENSYIIESS
ncbi:MAG TPA: hypothetical protein VI248_21825 [Kineosporiaceae bacterium]